jgi:glycosyltransferase involved in cell wall biosynthesis
MRIVLVADILIRDFDGCNRTLFHILDKSEIAGFEFLIIAGKVKGVSSKFKVIRVPNVTLPINKDYQIAFPYFLKQGVIESIKEFKPDIVHITSPTPLGNFVQNIAKDENLPVSTIYHTNFLSYLDYYFSSNSLIMKSLRKILVKTYVEFYNQCNIILCPTESMKTHLIDEGVKEDLISIWERGIDQSIFNVEAKDKRLIKSIFNNNNPAILFASRLVWEKNLKTLVKIYESSSKSFLPYNFLVVGDGMASNELKKLMPNAHFTGKVSQDDLSRYYASADVFVFPSVTETYGNVMIEAMNCGLPVVAANGGSNVDIVSNCFNGMLVDPFTEEEYLNAIKIVLSNREVFRRNAQYSYNNLSWETLILKLKNKLSIAAMDYNYRNYLKI